MRKYIILALTLLMIFSFASVAMAADTTGGLHIANPHQSFTSNTAACASCHTTHNAAGPKLLSGNNTYETCTNCHDGTESVYDVKNGEVGTTNAGAGGLTDAPAGLFEGASQSRHAADGGTSINPVSTSNLNGMGLYDHQLYGGTNIFTCASCHDPHKKLADQTEAGGFNSRLLKAAPRMIQKTDPKFSLSNDGAGNVTINTTAAGSVLNLSNGIYNTAPMKPVLYEVTAGPTYTQVAYTTFTPATKIFTGITGYGAGKAYAASFYVKAPLINIAYANDRMVDATRTAAEVPTYPDSINAWCGSCHNDYFLSTDAKAASGDYDNTKYRHAVGISDQGWVANGKGGAWQPEVNTVPVVPANVNMPLSGTSKIVCLTCHFAHGTKATSSIGKDAVTIAKDAAFGGGNINNVSKLLRYDNRDTCEFCHQK